MDIHTKRVRLWLAPALTVALVVPTMTNPASDSVQAQPDVPDEFLALADSSVINTAVLVSGVVAKPGGEVLTNGNALVVAFPREEVVNNTSVTGGFNWIPVSRAEIRPDGSFIARVAPTVDLSKNATEGVVNFELRVTGEDGVTQWGFPREITKSGSLLPDEAFEGSMLVDPSHPATRSLDSRPSSASSPLPLYSVTGLSQGAPTVRLTAQPMPEPLSNSVEQNAQDPGQGRGWDCEHRGVMTHRNVAVGHMYHLRGGVVHRFAYQVGSSSTLGYAFRIDGQGLGYRRGGINTKHSSNTTSWQKSNALDKRWYYTYWDYNVYNCREYGHPWKYKVWTIVPGPQRGGWFSKNYRYAPSAGYCSGTMERGGDWSITRGRSTTTSNGVSFSGAIGIDLSSQAGFNVETKHVFWPQERGRKVCGSRALPTQDGPG